MKETFKIAFINTIRLKRNWFYIILIGLLMSLSFLINTYSTTMHQFLNNDINNDFYSNTLLVGAKPENSSKLTRNNLEKQKHVVGVYSLISRMNGLHSDEFKSKNISGGIEVYASTNNALPPLIKGSKFPKGKGNYMICPADFYPNDGNYNKLVRNDFVNINQYLNKNIKFYYNDLETGEKQEITYKIIGIYKNNPTSIDEGVCFVNEDSLKEIYLNQVKNQRFLDINDQKGFYIQVDQAKNVKNVVESLENKGYIVSATTYIDYSMYENIDKDIQNQTILLYIIIAIILILIEYKIYKTTKEDLKLLSVIGYTWDDIIRIYVWKMTIFVCLSIMCAMIISILIFLGLNLIIYYKPLIFNKWSLVVDYRLLALSTILTVLISIFTSLIISKKLKRYINNV